MTQHLDSIGQIIILSFLHQAFNARLQQVRAWMAVNKLKKNQVLGGELGFCPQSRLVSTGQDKGALTQGQVGKSGLF